MVLCGFGMDVRIQILLLNTHLYNHECNMKTLKKPCRNSLDTPDCAFPCSAPLLHCSQVFHPGNSYQHLVSEFATWDYTAAELPWSSYCSTFLFFYILHVTHHNRKTERQFLHLEVAVANARESGEFSVAAESILRLNIMIGRCTYSNVNKILLLSPSNRGCLICLQNKWYYFTPLGSILVVGGNFILI